MKKLLIAAALMVMSGPSYAKDVHVSPYGDVAVRGAPCAFYALIDGEWQAANKRCAMIQDAETNNTMVWIGQGRIIIKRDPDERGWAKLYRVIPETDELGFMGNAVAKGNCWVGTTARFCAR
jgi:hypothetical protein